MNFSTSELRKYRDQARAMAVKAAIEKAHDVAKAGIFRIAEKPLADQRFQLERVLANVWTL